MGDQPGQDETIEVRRRRQGASTGPDSSERADMPSRRQQRGSGGPVGPFGGGGGGYIKGLPIGVVILLVICYGIYSLLFSNHSTNPSDTGLVENPTAIEDTPLPAQAVELSPTSASVKPAATRSVQASTPGQTWTVMLYQDADDQVLEQDILLDLNEAEKVGSSRPGSDRHADRSLQRGLHR